MNIYFAGSIRGGRDDAKNYLEIIKMLGEYGKVLTEHIGNEQMLEDEKRLTDKEIFDRDMAWLNGCEVVCAEVTQPSLGVGYELAMAKNTNKKVICLFNTSKGNNLSAMIAGDTYFKIFKYKNMMEAQACLKSYFGK